MPKTASKTATSVPIAPESSDNFFGGLVEKLKHVRGNADSSGAWGQGGASAEGQLAVDVAQTDAELVIMATIAGAKPEDISIHIVNDLLTIRGRRHHDQELKDDDYFYRECFWGSFSRTIVLPVDVVTEKARAMIKNGVLTIRIPKESPNLNIPIRVIED